MSIESNKELVRQFYDCLQQQNYEAMVNLVHPDFTFYSQIDTPHYGVEGFKEAEKKNFDAFPDFKSSVIDLIAEGDLVAVYMTIEGTHTGSPFAGIPATGKKVRVSLAQILRIADGKIVEKRAHFDRYDILMQLGVNLDDYVRSLSK